jgi:hypothetical protein
MSSNTSATSSTLNGLVRPFTVQIFLVDGIPDGVRIVEKDNWNGRGVVCPRPLLSAAQKRDEFGKPGIYVLIGSSENDDGLPVVYIGEGDPVRERLLSHDAKKDFWTQAIFFTGSLNKAHIRHLESRLIALAKAAKRCILDNSNQPTLPTLSEMDEASAETFLEAVRLCFGVLGFGFFEQPKALIEKSTSAQITIKPDLFTVQGKSIKATGYQSPNGFVVLQGSMAAAQNTPSLAKGRMALRKRLIETGILVGSGDHLSFSQDYEFSSASAAACICLGRSANGRTEWKNQSGQSLNDLAAIKISD